jgi:hypothetical protein
MTDQEIKQWIIVEADKFADGSGWTKNSSNWIIKFNSYQEGATALYNFLQSKHDEEIEEMKEQYAKEAGAARINFREFQSKLKEKDEEIIKWKRRCEFAWIQYKTLTQK